jgi:hypothetical protein
MNTEDQAWMQLREKAAARITPGFPDRVLRAARAKAPLLLSHYAMCAGTAAFCLLAIALYDAGASAEDNNAKSLAGWSEIAAQANDLEQGL